LLDLKDKYPDFYRFYGRRIAKKLSSASVKTIENHFNSVSLDQKIIDFYNNKKFINFSTNYKKVCIEIGFGDGEFLIKNSREDNNTLFIGSEVYLNGFIKVLKYINLEKVDNIKICSTNFIFLISVLNPTSIDRIYFINPDPWPKARHNKRRVINTNNLNLIKNKLKKKGEVVITTDCKNYYEDMLDILKDPLLEFKKSDFYEMNKNDKMFGISNYQRKAIIKKHRLYKVSLIND
tara:strand:- start:114 stop:818 length:705 start_codon:yes stop_codon:yes gene_type:complete